MSEARRLTLITALALVVAFIFWSVYRSVDSALAYLAVGLGIQVAIRVIAALTVRVRNR